MSGYVVVLTEKEDWDNPQIGYYLCESEEEAYEAFAKDKEFTVDELDEGEEEGDICITVKEVE